MRENCRFSSRQRAPKSFWCSRTSVRPILCRPSSPPLPLPLRRWTISRVVPNRSHLHPSPSWSALCSSPTLATKAQPLLRTATQSWWTLTPQKTISCKRCRTLWQVISIAQALKTSSRCPITKCTTTPSNLNGPCEVVQDSSWERVACHPCYSHNSRHTETAKKMQPVEASDKRTTITAQLKCPLRTIMLTTQMAVITPQWTT